MGQLGGSHPKNLNSPHVWRKKGAKLEDRSNKIVSLRGQEVGLDLCVCVDDRGRHVSVAILGKLLFFINNIFRINYGVLLSNINS